MNANVLKNPAILDTVRRVRQVGLHKIAAQMHGLPEITLKTAMVHLGEQLYAHQLRHRAIRTGLNALEFLEKE